MKKIAYIFILLFFVSVLFFVFKQKDEFAFLQQEEVAPQILKYEQMENEPIKWTDIETTAQLEELFKDVRFDKIPKIFVRRFPNDFKDKGSPVLLATALLPHLLRQNELLLAERDAFLAIADKMKNNQNLTKKEEEFWNRLVLKYEVLESDKSGQQELLFRRIDRISPSLAIAQSIEATQNAKTHLDSPFDVRRWNEKKEYDFVRYSDLASAVADYALELNRGYSYLKFHMLRSTQRPSRTPLKGESFARGLIYYKIEDVDYLNKLQAIFDYYQFQILDESQFIKEN